MMSICAVHVDDVLTAYNDQSSFDEFWTKFRTKFGSTLGTVDKYLGMEVCRDRDARRVVLTQTVYIEKMFAKYLSASNTKAWTTPVDLTRDGIAKFYTIVPAESDAEKNQMQDKDFSGLLGSLLYASCMTRPDIAFYTTYLAQFMQSPSVAAWDAALSVASYLHSTKELGIAFGGDHQTCCVPDVPLDKARLVIFSDASFGRDIHPFVGGFVQWRQGPVSWISRKAKFVPQSSCEVEVFGVVLVLKEGEFVTQIADFVDAGLASPVAAITDNKAARDVIKYPGATKRTVHFDRWLHFARELHLRNKVEIFLCGTDDMMADGMTKPVDKTKFLKCRNYILSGK